MKSKTLIRIFIVIVIVYFLYNYYFNKTEKEPFVNETKSFVRENYRNVNNTVSTGFNNIKNGVFRQIRTLGM